MRGRVVDARVQLGDPSDHLVCRLDPRLGRLSDPNDIARSEPVAGPRVQADVVGLTRSGLDSGEELAGLLVMEALAPDDSLEGRG